MLYKTFTETLFFSFPVINFIAIFVSAALGADDVFVATDKWKNARRSNLSVTSTEDIAGIVLPDAAGAMLLTTSTTGIAFFAMCIAPIAPIYTFALFCGLTVIFNYLLNCMLLFPALCIYDKWRIIEEVHEDHLDTRRNLIHRILRVYYNFLHRYRYPIIALFAGSLTVSIYFALTIRVPDNSDVRMLPSNYAFEMHYEWKRLLLSSELFVATSLIRVFWGVEPADTGDLRNPETKSTLELDNSFDPSSEEAQGYLKSFCQKFIESEYVLAEGFVCPIKAFEDWLIEQDTLLPDAQDASYTTACGDANSIPMDEDYFHSCFSSWSTTASNATNDSQTVLSRDGFVKMMWCEAPTSISFNDPYYELGETWTIFESFIQTERAAAPAGVNHMFQSSSVWWW